MDYTTYLTSEHQVPNLQAIVTGLTQPLNDIQAIDIDLNVNTATGYFLNVIGAWVGVSRKLPTPLDAQLLWDTPNRNWDSLFSWVAEGTPINGIVYLDDNTYRNLIKFTIAKNYYDGTKQGAINVLSNLYTTDIISIEDMGNMMMNVIVIGSLYDTITLALLENGYLNLAPFGVGNGYLEVSRDTNLMFSWDNNTEYFGGWDTSSWANVYNI